MFKELNTLRQFFDAPNTEYNVREVGRIINITPATASKRLKELKDEGYITYRKERMLDLYKADIDSEKYRDIKVYYTIRQLKDTGLVDAINKFYLKPTIVLFGSSSSGMDNEDSDLDLLIISENKKILPGQKIFERRLKRNIQFFIHKNISEIKNEHLINNMINGIKLQGNIRWILKPAKEKDL